MLIQIDDIAARSQKNIRSISESELKFALHLAEIVKKIINGL